MSEMVERVARAMKLRASQPVENLKSLEPVLVGSLGDAWPYLARAAIEAMREPTEGMCKAHWQTCEVGGGNAAAWRAMIDEALK